MPADGGLPKENFRNWLNEFRHDLKFHYVSFCGYCRLCAYKYMLWKNSEIGLLRHLIDARGCVRNFIFIPDRGAPRAARAATRFPALASVAPAVPDRGAGRTS